jgi:hypothetical protein
MNKTSILKVITFVVVGILFIIITGAMFRFQPLFYAVMSLAAVFSGYPLLWLFGKDIRKKIFSAILLGGILFGGALGAYWDDLVPDVSRYGALKNAR